MAKEDRMKEPNNVEMLQRVLSELVGQNCSDAILANDEVLQLEFGDLAAVPDSPRGVRIGEQGLVVGDGSWELRDPNGEILLGSNFVDDASAVERGLDAMQASITDAHVTQDLSLALVFASGRKLVISCDAPAGEPCWELFLTDHMVFTAYANGELTHGRSDV
jgi:hypothetical protein